MLDKKAYLQEIQKMAQGKGGRCLADEYVNSTAKMPFECKHGHQFTSCRDYIKAGNWCPFCAGRGKTIEDLQKLAAKQGGRCLSTVFLGVEKKHLWECAEGHQWEAIPRNIQSLDRWCPACGLKKSGLKRRKYTLEDMQKLANTRGGICLSSSFEIITKKLTWQCSIGHVWEAIPHSLQGGTWCPFCALEIRSEKRKTRTIEDVKEFALTKGGKCLSESFQNVKSSLLWECSEGHQWQANTDNIINGGKWCPICAGTSKKSIEDMQKIAIERGGKCLSENYDGINKKLLWQCQEGHIWQAIPSAIKRGGWCPECSSGLGERICRAFFEQLFDAPFPKARPDWLRTLEGKRMELDGYSSELKIAFEHQGIQHYKNIKYFHGAFKNLERIQERDLLKQEFCRLHGIHLIQIPSILDILGIDNVKSWLYEELVENNIAIPLLFHEKTVDLSQVYCPNRIRELQNVAMQRGGKLISQKYLGIFEPLEWRCEKGHHFKAAPNNVKNSGSWCPKCIGRGKTIQDMQDIAMSRGGKCLSTEYIKTSSPLLWQCKEGHQWKARPGNVLSGTWCPECATKIRAEKRRKNHSSTTKTHQLSIFQTSIINGIVKFD